MGETSADSFYYCSGCHQKVYYFDAVHKEITNHDCDSGGSITALVIFHEACVPDFLAETYSAEVDDVTLSLLW